MADDNTAVTDGEEEIVTPDTVVTGGNEAVVEDKADDKVDASSDDETRDDTKGDRSGVPDKYEFNLPEGVELDEAKAEEFSAIAKEVKLSNEDASKFVGLYTKAQAEAFEAQVATWNKQLDEWKEAATKDEEFGGAKFQESVGNAKRALDVFGNEKLKEALNQSGMGNHPEIIRMLSKVGAAAGDDSFVFGKAAGAEKKSAADILFPNQGK